MTSSYPKKIAYSVKKYFCGFSGIRVNGPKERSTSVSWLRFFPSLLSISLIAVTLPLMETALKRSGRPRTHGNIFLFCPGECLAPMRESFHIFFSIPAPPTHQVPRANVEARNKGL